MNLLRALTWNVFHGRDFAPDPALHTLRSRLCRVTERSATHAQVNRDLSEAFASVLAAADWDVALLQECPPRWEQALARRCDAETHRVLTARNALLRLRTIAARINPDLIGSNEGGSNLILVRRARSRIVERRELVLCPGPAPERRALAFVRLADGVCIANLHASSGPANRSRAEAELRLAAERSLEWAAGAPLLLGGDLNVRPRDSQIYAELSERFELGPATAPNSLDHILARGMRVVDPPAAWPAERRDVARTDGLRIRLSDHAPVGAAFDLGHEASGKLAAG